MPKLSVAASLVVLELLCLLGGPSQARRDRAHCAVQQVAGWRVQRGRAIFLHQDQGFTCCLRAMSTAG